MSFPGESIQQAFSADGEIRELLTRFREIVSQKEMSDLSVALVVEKISAASEEKDYGSVKTAIKQQIYDARKWQEILQELLSEVEKLETRRAKRDLCSDRWWQEKQEALHETFDRDPQQGQDEWLGTFAEALIAWELDICEKLVSESFPFPSQMTEMIPRFQAGIQAIKREQYPQALPMLNHLVKVQSAHGRQPVWDDVSQTTLLVFVGRIYLYKISQPEEALKFFEQAKQLTPNYGLSDAARGEYFRQKGSSEEALSSFQEALSKSNTLPDGYIGMGLYAEDQGWWDEVEDWYGRAINQVEDEKNPVDALSKLLMPADGNLLLQLARILQENQPTAALQAVNRAIQIGIQGEGSYPQRWAYQLKGEILEQLEQSLEAVEAYYEAGKQLYWSGDYDSAIAEFEKLLHLNPDYVMAYWYLADALLVQSYTQDLPYVDREKLQQSLDRWNQGKGIALPDVKGSWAYVIRARISERLSLLEAQATADRYIWESLGYVERALLLDDQEFYRLSTLGRYYRWLGVNFNALYITQKATDLKPDEPSVQEDRAGILINVGEYESAISLVEQLQEKYPAYPMYDGWRAIICYYQGDYNTSLELIQKGVDKYPEDLWYRMIQADAYRMEGQKLQAYESYAKVWEKRNSPNYPQEQTTFASAAYNLYLLDDPGDRTLVDEAIQLYTSVLNLRTQACNAHLQLTLCYLITSDFTASEQHFTDGLDLVTNRRELDNLSIELSFLEEILPAKDHPPQNTAAMLEQLQKFKAAVTAKRKELENQQGVALDERKAAIAELTHLLNQEPESQVGSQSWLAIEAGLGRLYLEENQLEQAEIAYRQLQKYLDQFPEARLGLEKVASRLQSQGTEFLKARRFADAISVFQHAIALQDLPSKTLADLRCNLGTAYIGLNDRNQAQESFGDAIERYRQEELPNPGEVLGQVCSETIPDIAHYWKMDEAFASFAALPETEPGFAQAFALARPSLSKYLEQYYETFEEAGGSSKWMLSVTPVAVEISQNLVPDETGTEWVLFKTYVPEMRERLLQQMGVRVPGIRVRGNEADLPPDTYILMLDEIPLILGTVKSGQVYSPTSDETLQDLGIPAAALSPTNHPGTGQPGCWIDPDVCPDYPTILDGQGLKYWADPLLYMVYHLESFLRQNLADCLGAQDVAYLLDEWSQQEDGASLIATALPNATAQLRFGRVLRALVAEQVSIAPWREILRAVAEVGLVREDVDAVVRHVRQSLKPYLPGNEPGAPCELIPDAIEQEIERWLWPQGEKLFFAIPPQDTQDLLSDIREIVPPVSEAPRFVFITRSGRVRPFLRRLVELEFPHVMAIAEDERLSQEKLPQERLETDSYTEIDRGEDW
jgi:tetratricopeptide (TPR) repeat protein